MGFKTHLSLGPLLYTCYDTVGIQSIVFGWWPSRPTLKYTTLHVKFQKNYGAMSQPSFCMGYRPIPVPTPHLAVKLLALLLSLCYSVAATVGAIAHRVWERKSPSGVQGRSPGRRSGGLVSRSWGSLQTLFTDFDCRNDQNLKILYNFPPDSWPVFFTVREATFWELSPP